MKKKVDNKFSSLSLYVIMLTFEDKKPLLKGGITTDVERRLSELRRKNKATTAIVVDTCKLANFNTEKVNDKVSKLSLTAKYAPAENAMLKAITDAGYSRLKMDNTESEYFELTSDVVEVEFNYIIRTPMSKTIRLRA
ncbi:MAG: GIY-YIG nuclease family protein [Bacteroidia bacterium]|nr:GIY-YIG nuclease family protein [Bacteroidia bacterium]